MYLCSISDVLSLTNLNVGIHGCPEVCDAEDTVRALECLLKRVYVAEVGLNNVASTFLQLLCIGLGGVAGHRPDGEVLGRVVENGVYDGTALSTSCADDGYDLFVGHDG